MKLRGGTVHDMCRQRYILSEKGVRQIFGRCRGNRSIAMARRSSVCKCLGVPDQQVRDHTTIGSYSSEDLMEPAHAKKRPISHQSRLSLWSMRLLIVDNETSHRRQRELPVWAKE